MEFGRLNLTFCLGMMACLTSLGCAETSGYINFADLPSPPGTSVAVDESGRPPQSVDTSVDTVGPEAGNSDPAVRSPSATDTGSIKENAAAPEDQTQSGTGETSKGVQPASATPDDGKQSPVTLTTNVVLDPSTVPTTGALPGSPPGLDIAINEEPVEPREIKLLIPEKRFRPEGDSDTLRLTYDDIDLLKILNMEPVPFDAPKHFPEWLQQLHGRRIRIRGFMFPTFKATD